MMLVVRFFVEVAFALAVVGCDQAHEIQFAPVVAGQADLKGDDGRWHRMPLAPE